MRHVSRGRRERPAESVFIRSFGCPSNLADAKVMEGALIEAGYEISDNVSSADFLIYNTCAVKTPTEDRMISVLGKVPSSKHLIVTGCLPAIHLDRVKREVKFSGISGPSSGSEIIKLLSRVKMGLETTEIKIRADLDPLLPSLQSGNLISIVPIAYGCLGSCSYCCVKTARGALRSHFVREIIPRIREDVRQGTREIWLTGQDLGCYGYDIGTTLPDLLTEIAEIDGEFRVRIGMMNPQHVLEIQQELAQSLKSSRIFKFLHIPVQSGDDQVLERMNRKYSSKDFMNIISKFRKEIRRITIATDVICGFPGENRDAFENTVQLLKEVKPEVLNISRFFPRPTAPKPKGEKVSPSEKNRRSRILAEVSKGLSLAQNSRWIGWKGEALVDEIGRENSWTARNHAYRPVVVSDEADLFGRFINVKICGATSTHLVGKLQ